MTYPLVELPLDIHSPNATYETQFGYVQRPTHKNTTWDIAKVIRPIMSKTPFTNFIAPPVRSLRPQGLSEFSILVHILIFFVQYVDFSEFGYGVAILSESKYGFSCIGDVLRISLLRAATAPDAEQDQGVLNFAAYCPLKIYPDT
jgi:alpha-mannosidase